MLNFRRNVVWIIIGGATCLFASILLIIPQRQQVNANSATSSPTISPSPIAIDSRGDRQDPASVQNSAVPPEQFELQKEQFSLPPQPDQAVPDQLKTEVHRKIAAGLDVTIRKETRRLYEGAFQQLHLPVDLQEKVIDILTQQQRQLEQQAFEAAQSGNVLAPFSPEEMRAQQVQQDQQLRSILGDAGFIQFNQYQTTIPDHLVIDAMNQEGGNLTESQSRQLLQILGQERQQIIDQSGTTQNLASVPPAQAMSRIEQQQALLQQAISDRVQSILSPDQRTTLQTILSRYATAPKAP